MNMKKLLYRLKAPCSRCPYKLGLVETPVNPCPQCRMNGYQTFDRFLKQMSKEKMCLPRQGEPS